MLQKLSSRIVLVPALIALTLAYLPLERAVAGPVFVTDRLWSDGTESIDWGPGIWTEDGVEIGRTFGPNGESTPAPGVPIHLEDSIQLPTEPNDFHFTVSFPRLLRTHEVWVTFDLGIDPFEFFFEIFLADAADEIMSEVDLVADTILVTDVSTGTVLFNGGFSSFSPTLVAGLQSTGDIRHANVISEPSTTLLFFFGAVSIFCLARCTKTGKVRQQASSTQGIFEKVGIQRLAYR